ncbi:Pentatricopeptide repeat-containing protein [Acorus calamus]|uniref:Pentatricopeptide repeat-containing protein n=1 Tax=Acorus calamus TaxID=4465 RepID=A0AAV9EKY7_ACOCL|nr:Pentatricopeptide repeat-containing protein [Acorus calamus]
MHFTFSPLPLTKRAAGLSFLRRPTPTSPTNPNLLRRTLAGTPPPDQTPQDSPTKLFDEIPHRNTFAWNQAIAGLMRRGDVKAAKQVFERMPSRDVVTWNSMISGLVKNSRVHEAVSLFHRMPSRTVVSWNLVLSGLLNHVSFEAAERFYEEMPERDVVSQTMMVSALSGLGRVDDARTLFDAMLDRDARAWNAMLVGYANNGRIEVAAALFVKMPARDSCSWNSMLDGLAGNGRLGDAIRLFAEIPRKGLLSFNLIALGLIRNGFVAEAHALFEKIPFKDVVSWTNMMVGYFESGDVAAARELFASMPCRDETSWNAFIYGLSENDFGEEALRTFARMNSEGPPPDRATFTTALNACSILPSLSFGKQAHAEAIKAGYGDSVSVSNATITMYARCGSMRSARTAFFACTDCDTVTWNAIICGFANHGDGREALNLFERMRWTDCEPNEITFIGVLSACSHAGLVREGQHFFNYMIHECGLKPNSQHYACVVDLLGRFGHLEEAKRIVERMPDDGVKARASVWGALLGACRIYKDVELGEVSGWKVLEIDPLNAGAYVIMAELYAGGGRRREAEKVLDLMRRGA